MPSSVCASEAFAWLGLCTGSRAPWPDHGAIYSSRAPHACVLYAPNLVWLWGPHPVGLCHVSGVLHLGLSAALA